MGLASTLSEMWFNVACLVYLQRTSRMTHVLTSEGKTACGVPLDSGVITCRLDQPRGGDNDGVEPVCPDCHRIVVGELRHAILMDMCPPSHEIQ